MTDLVSQPVSVESFIDEWERQPGETARQFKAFVLYRDMGDERGVMQVRSKVGFNAKATTLMTWAKTFRWIERANAYDRMLDRRRQAAHIEEVEALARRQVQIGQTLQQRGLEYVKEELAKPEQRAKNLGANSALRFIEKGVDLERQGLGVEDKDSGVDVNVQINVLDGQTKADVFDTIDQMANNMAEVKAMMSERSNVIDVDEIEDAELVEG
jgi:hypothetical protein